MKIVDKIKEKMAKGEKFYSFEFFPPRTEEGVENLFEKLERMAAHAPVFCDITWGAGGSTADLTLDIAVKMQNLICVETMMHLTCTNMQVEKLESALKQVKAAGLQNILALRGDPPKGQEKFEAVEGGFSCALDLVRYIRKEFGDYFGICVAGYPEAHPDTIVDDPEQMEKNYWANIDYLKQKVEAGADIIITQLFYDVDIFLKFVDDCRKVGITVPILPGIMPIMTYGGFKRMIGFCKTKVPQDIADKVESLKDDEEGLKAYGMELGASMCKRILDAGIPGLHMYSLNLDRSTLGILEKLGVIDTKNVPRTLPWKLIPSGTARQVEGVRPVNWAKRPKSYITRTRHWATFPKSRWSEVAGQTFGPLSANPYMQHVSTHAKRKAHALSCWGEEVKSVEEVANVFAKYYKGEIDILPWAGVPATAGEMLLRDQLLALVDRGLLPLQARPALNALPSSDSQMGWGAPNGVVYQKGYVEFFASPEQYAKVLEVIKGSPNVSYLAATATGSVESTKPADGAVSWGVYPGKEVVQPLVVDPQAFAAWKEEAFELWSSNWAGLYEADSSSAAVLEGIKKSWYLVAVLDNDFINGNVFKALGL
mmetsp:Transcript_20987/g.45966  ORF Transcript_20987/g.45966 Transcript_20987/m.45966 type:complete len:596 (-) Transcript_20987:433-2220(-)|eukprot:CAMPEP_0202901946 /NCGR_PEP_ID=MMETSP1392-20130828/15440_1 /ASSEMBLY_ACC=CAM_ASM_000868 /TAXON_ID=225041 /ORGANISM="Chlamydomonas chlamydogama, Strain SAG 11-48b" /LENGTH=595 /DNA_ID=CAMNT_0049588609 /DNA_START=149 /DNA_END=1936 /DNA_ORIENTATION=+